MQKNKLEKQIKAAILIQKHWKRFVARKKFLKLLKRQKKKIFAAKQILQSQQKYCQQIEFVINKVMIPSKTFINNPETIKNLFSNIQQIFKIHSHFLKCLEKVMQNFNPQTTLLSQVLMKQLINKEAFKLAYENYCSQYKIIDNTIKIVMQKNNSMTNHLTSLGLASTNLTLESYMIKPVQRLCKYSLLIDQYQKNMEINHIDYKMIGQTSILIDKMVLQTNDRVQQFLMTQRFQELNSYFYSFFSKIHSSKKLRMFYETKQITILDLIKEQEYKYKSMALFENTVIFLPDLGKEPTFSNFLFCRQLVNHKYYKNIIQLVDRNKYTYVQFTNEKDKKEFMRVVQAKLNQSNREQFKEYIKVNILGTQNRQSFFSSYTVYIVLIDEHGKTSTIYPRFKDLLKVQQMVIQRGLNLNPPLLAKQSLIATLKSKTIEKRKLTIQEFLERVFNNCPISDIKEAQEILGVSRIGRALSQRMYANVEEIAVMLPNMQKVKVMIGIHDNKIKDLKILISQQMGMQNSNQFQLFQIRNKDYSNKKILHEEQSVKKIYDEQKESSQSLNPFRDTVEYLYTRHYYLNHHVQQELYKCDQARAQLEISVIHWQVANYRLQQQVMLTFMCLFAIYIHLPIQDSQKLNFFIKQLGKKNYKVSEEEFRIYFSEVRKTVNMQQNIAQNLPLLIIKVVSNSYLYQTQQFQVQVHHKIFSSIKKLYPSIQEKIVLGFHPQLVYLLSLKDKSVITKFSYSQLSLQCHTKAVVFQLPHTQVPLTLKTTQIFQIRKLFQIYKNEKVK